MTSSYKSDLFLKFVKTSVADLLTLEFNNTALSCAEVTAGGVFGKYDLVAVNVYFYRVGIGNIHLFSHFLRYNDSAKLVNVSNNAC